jgi:hypothetical protein
VEFIDSTGYDDAETELLLRRTCDGGGWMIGKMERETCFWEGPLETLHEAVCAWSHFDDDVLEGISVDTVRKLVEIRIEDMLKNNESRAANLEKTKHPKTARQVREDGQSRAGQQRKLLEGWIKRRTEAR